MNETDLHFIQLVLSLQTGAMVQLGKIASPLSGKLERRIWVRQSDYRFA